MDPAEYLARRFRPGRRGPDETDEPVEEVMAHKITDECIACGTCVDECPVDAITEGDPIYLIDAEECTDCAACVEVCPTDAIIEG